jgi:4'-phosphopantetheinyl transferase
MFLPAPTNLILSPDDLYIWKIELKSSTSELEYCEEILSSDEMDRANRFYFPKHRQRFMIGRGSLRTILSRYLDVKPEQIKFDYQPRGKPVLDHKFAKSQLSFNLAHSEDLALCAVSYQRQIGVDLEFIRPMSDLVSLAQRYFLPREYEVLRSLFPEQQQQVFFRYWTCKEAYLKATGVGLTDLDQVEIALKINKPAKLLVSDQWSLHELIPADNFIAAVVVAGDMGNLQFWEY